MPTTIYGIGTHYYGRRLLTKRVGMCVMCQQRGELSSYETRLWFVVSFVPLLPLKRVRVLDDCPRCCRHYAIDPEEFEATRQLATSQALAKHREQQTLETAVQAHGELLGFQLPDEARKFRNTVLEQLPEDVELRKAFASQLDQMLDRPAAQQIYRQILELDPNDPLSRTQRALHLLHDPQGLEEAWKLTDFLREPGAGTIYNLSVLDSLSQKLQAAGQPGRALKLLDHLLAEFPDAADRHEIRRRVTRLEREVGREQSRLPPRPFSARELFDSGSGRYPGWLRWATFLGLASLVLLAILGGTNEFFRRHRRVHVVSSFAQPVQVAIDDSPARNLGPQGFVWLAEGSHRLRITAPIEREISLEIRTPWWSRWTRSPVWVWNVAGTARLVHSDLDYAAHPRPAGSRLISPETHHEPHVDYPFIKPPQTLQVKRRGTDVRKVALEALSPNPVDWIVVQPPDVDSELLFTYAEGHLTANPRDELLLNIYSRYATGLGHTERAEAFLKGGLWREPLSIEWHHAYSQLDPVCRSPAELVREYTDRLVQSPDDARLLYLAACWRPPFEAEMVESLQRAQAADPQLGWPALALARWALSRGEWDEAKRWFRLAQAALPRRQLSLSTLHTLALATGEFAEETTVLGQVRQTDQGLTGHQTTLWLVESAARQGDCDQVFRLLRGLEGVATFAGQPLTGGLFHADHYEELCGPREGLRTEASPADPRQRLHQMLLRGERQALEELPSPQDTPASATSDWMTAGAIAIACDTAQLEELAGTWRQATAAILRHAAPAKRQAALWLAQQSPPTDEELARFGGLTPTEGAVWHALMAGRFPSHRSRHRDWVRRLNIGCVHPARLLDKWLALP